MNLLLIGAYFFVLLGIGWYSGKRETASDFANASQQVGVLQTSASMFAVLGGVVLAGQATLAFILGVGALWFWLGIAIGVLIVGFAGGKVKHLAREFDFLTIGEFFRHHWGRANGLVAAVILFVGFFALLTAQFVVVGNLLSPFLGFTYTSVILITGLVVLGYLLLGGYKAVIITDSIQALLMLGVLVLVAAVIPYGNFTADQLSLFSLDIISILSFVLLGAATIVASADLWQRIFSARTISVVRHASVITAALYVFLGFVVSLLGMAAANSFPGGNPDEALFLGMFELIPPELLGLSMVMVLAAVMSTVDTESFLLSSIIAKDFLPKKNLDKRGLKHIIRWALVVVTIISVAVALLVTNILTLLFGLLSLIITLAPAIFGSFFWRLKSRAVLLSMLAGVASLIYLGLSGNFSPEAASITFPVALVFLLLGQLIFRNSQSARE